MMMFFNPEFIKQQRLYLEVVVNGLSSMALYVVNPKNNIHK